MACNRCGAKKGHFPGCRDYKGQRAGRKPASEQEPKPMRTCTWCAGTGTNAKGRNCIRCGGSGQVATS